jgi:CRISPR-associated endoribonuclease Cas6
MAKATSSTRGKTKSKSGLTPSPPQWARDTELLGLVFDLEPPHAVSLYSQYTIGLHAWFLDQVRQLDPELSAYLHDGESEKPFSLSALEGQLLPSGKQLQLIPNQIYQWHVNALSQPVVQLLEQWLTQRPPTLDLKGVPLEIKKVRIAHPPTTYTQLLQFPLKKHATVNFSFISPTSFRRKGHHFPLPVPVNLFHSYLRRWNDFSGMPVEQEAFLDWIDEAVVIRQYKLESVKVAAGKRGSVTGFVGVMSLGLSQAAVAKADFCQIFYALAQLAPYCGTGHKTTFGLGQTCSGWVEPQSLAAEEVLTHLLGERIEELTEIFTAQQRTGGDRAAKVAATRATILARREMGESLQAIAQDLEMPYSTVKTYVKLARRALKQNQ